MDLQPHEIEPGDFLGDRMLDLETRVDLEEVELAASVDDELNGAGVLVADGASRGDSSGAHAGAQLVVDGRGGRFFDDLLVAALDRALAFEAVDEIPVRVAEDLDLDVSRRAEVAFDQQRVVAERVLGLAARRFECSGELARVVHDAHALAAAAGRRLDQHRIADLAGRAAMSRVGRGLRR